MKKHLEGDENTFSFDCGCGYMTIYIYQNSLKCTHKKDNCSCILFIPQCNFIKKCQGKIENKNKPDLQIIGLLYISAKRFIKQPYNFSFE